MMLAALFWRRSNKWGALAAVLWVVFSMVLLWWLQLHSNGIAPKPGQPPVPIFAGLGGLFLRTPMNVTIFGYMPVMFMCLGSAFWMALVSLLTPAPTRATLEKFFPPSGRS
jgi:Na+/proline symporter